MKVPALLLLLAAAAFAAEPSIIPIWPGVAPGSEGWTGEERVVAAENGEPRIYNVTRPTLTAYLPDASTATGAAIVVCPGGGFYRLAVDHEGTQVARWLNSIGVAAFVLKYRVNENVERRRVAEMAAADGRQAIRLVRSRAAEWGLAKDRIGIMGFSAGGYVASFAALDTDPESRPNFAAPIYPGVPDNIKPSAGAPPLFLLHATDDNTVDVTRTTLRMYTAWREAGLPVEMHVYTQGGHGFGMRKSELPARTWPDRLRDWMSAMGFLKR
jgi:acetyl esterase/lipase